MVEPIRSGSWRGGVELAAPPGSDWCGDKKRSQGGEEGTLSGAGVGGGVRLASHVLPGDFERGRDPPDLWQVNLAGYSRGWIWQIFMARHSGGSFWWIYLAGSHE